MTFLKTALLATTVALSVGACRDNEAGSRGEASAAVERLDIRGVSDRELAARFSVEPREVPTASAEEALERLNLLEESDELSWASRTGGNGNYVFTDIVVMEDGERVGTVAELTLLGLREDGASGVAMDKLEADGIDVRGEGAGDRIRVDDLVLIRPRADDIGSLVGDGADTDLPEAEAAAANGITFVSEGADGGTLTLESVAFADSTSIEDPDGFFTLGEMSFEGTDENGMAVEAEFEGGSASGFQSLDEMSNPMSAANPYGAAGMEIDFGAGRLAADTLRVSFAGLQGTTEEARGGRLESRIRMEPLTVGFTDAPTAPGLLELYEGISGLGYEEVTVTLASDSVVDPATDTITSEGGYFEIEDGLRVEMDTVVRGFAALREAQADALREAGFDTPPGNDATDEERARYAQVMGEGAMAAVGELEVDRLVLRMDDNSLLERIFTLAAEEQGTSTKVLKMQAKGMLQMGTMMGSGAGIDPEITAELVEALAGWIDSPGSTFVLSLDPETPLGANTLASGSVPSKAELGFSASVEE